MRLKGKVALITGSTKGMGRATAELFAREGASVVVTGRDRAAGGEIVARIEKAGGTAVFEAADFRDEAAVKKLVAQSVSEFGKLDILVNNASPTNITRGPGRLDGRLADMSKSDWEEVFTGSSIGFFLASKYAIKAMLAEGNGGSIVNISSAMAVRGFPDSAAYPAAKGAIDSLTLSIAATYGPAGIRANAIIAGLIMSSPEAMAATTDPHFGPRLMEGHIIKRWGQPEDVAYGSLYLASDEASFVTGSLLFIDGGISCKTPFPSVSEIDFDGNGRR